MIRLVPFSQDLLIAPNQLRNYRLYRLPTLTDRVGANKISICMQHAMLVDTTSISDAFVLLLYESRMCFKVIFKANTPNSAYFRFCSQRRHTFSLVTSRCLSLSYSEFMQTAAATHSLPQTGWFCDLLSSQLMLLTELNTVPFETHAGDSIAGCTRTQQKPNKKTEKNAWSRKLSLCLCDWLTMAITMTTSTWRGN